MPKAIRFTTSLLCLSTMLLLQGCTKAADTKATAPAPAAATGLKTTDPMTAYGTATDADRAAVIAPALALVATEIDRKGKSDDEMKTILVPCLKTTYDVASPDDRSKGTVMDLVVACIVLNGFKK